MGGHGGLSFFQRDASSFPLLAGRRCASSFPHDLTLMDGCVLTHLDILTREEGGRWHWLMWGDSLAKAKDTFRVQCSRQRMEVVRPELTHSQLVPWWDLGALPQRLFCKQRRSGESQVWDLSVDAGGSGPQPDCSVPRLGASLCLSEPGDTRAPGGRRHRASLQDSSS